MSAVATLERSVDDAAAAGYVAVVAAVVVEINTSLPHHLPFPVEMIPHQEINYLDGEATVFETIVDAFPVSVRVREYIQVLQHVIYKQN